MSCRETAEEFKIGKRKAANFVANQTHLRAECENFQRKGYKHIHHGNHQRFEAINNIIYSWYTKCKAPGIYITRPIWNEEVMNLKSCLNQSVLEDFRASDGWLDK